MFFQITCISLRKKKHFFWVNIVKKSVLVSSKVIEKKNIGENLQEHMTDNIQKL